MFFELITLILIILILELNHINEKQNVANVERWLRVVNTAELLQGCIFRKFTFLHSKIISSCDSFLAALCVVHISCDYI